MITLAKNLPCQNEQGGSGVELAPLGQILQVTTDENFPWKTLVTVRPGCYCSLMSNELDYDPDECQRCFGALDEDGECDYCQNVYDDDGDVGFMYEHDSSMASVGWGTDEDYGYYGDDY